MSAREEISKIVESWAGKDCEIYLTESEKFRLKQDLTKVAKLFINETVRLCAERIVEQAIKAAVEEVRKNPSKYGILLDSVQDPLKGMINGVQSGRAQTAFRNESATGKRKQGSGASKAEDSGDH